MRIKQNLFFAFFVFAFTLAAFGQAQPPQTRVSLYGIQSLDFGQSLRVMVQNQRFSDSEIIPCIRVRGVFDFYEISLTSTNRLRLSRSVTREATVCAGEAALFDMPAAREGSLVSVSIFTTCVSDVICDGSVRVASTLNLREAGRTILTLPAVEKGFDPQPDPPNEP